MRSISAIAASVNQETSLSPSDTTDGDNPASSGGPVGA